MSTESPFFPPKQDARYPILRALAEENWRENNPKPVKTLEKNNLFEKTLDSKTEQEAGTN